MIKAEIYQKFYEKALRRLSLGEIDVFRDKPEGFTEWLKKHKEKTGGIRLPKLDNIPITKCWKCKKEYRGRKCPYCGAFKPRK